MSVITPKEYRAKYDMAGDYMGKCEVIGRKSDGSLQVRAADDGDWSNTNIFKLVDRMKKESKAAGVGMIFTDMAKGKEDCFFSLQNSRYPRPNGEDGQNLHLAWLSKSAHAEHQSKGKAKGKAVKLF